MSAGRLFPNMMHQGQKCLAVFLDKRKSQAFHVVEVAVERRRRDAGKLGDFPEAERVETPTRG